MECHCCSRSVQDLFSEGKTLQERRLGEPFSVPILPLRSMIENHPTSAKNNTSLHQMEKKVLSGFGKKVRLRVRKEGQLRVRKEGPLRVRKEDLLRVREEEFLSSSERRSAQGSGRRSSQASFEGYALCAGGNWREDIFVAEIVELLENEAAATHIKNTLRKISSRDETRRSN